MIDTHDMRIETLAFGYGLIEGPRVDGAGNLYFSDVTNGGVFRRRPDGSIDTVVPKRRGVGGIALHADGGIVISGKNICHVRDGQTRVLVRARGRAGLQRPLHRRPGPRLHRLDALEPVQRERAAHAGRVLPDRRRRARDRALRRRVTHERHRLLARRPHDLPQRHRPGPDPRAPARRERARDAGDTDPCRGRARRAGGRRRGRHLGRALPGGLRAALPARAARPTARIAVPARAVTSLCFGGGDLRDLYVVSADNTDDPSRGGTIFRTRSDVAGLPAPFARI